MTPDFIVSIVEVRLNRFNNLCKVCPITSIHLKMIATMYFSQVNVYIEKLKLHSYIRKIIFCNITVSHWIGSSCIHHTSRLIVQIIKIQIKAIDKILHTCVRATAVHVLRLTRRPKRALPLTMQYGTPILRHKAGRNNTICKMKKRLH